MSDVALEQKMGMVDKASGYMPISEQIPLDDTSLLEIIKQHIVEFAGQQLAERHPGKKVWGLKLEQADEAYYIDDGFGLQRTTKHMASIDGHTALRVLEYTASALIEI